MSISVRASLALVLLLLGTSVRAQPATDPPGPPPRAPPGSRAGSAGSELGSGATAAAPPAPTATSADSPGPPDTTLGTSDGSTGEAPALIGPPDAAAGPGSAVLHEHGSATGYETTIEAPAPTSAASAESIRDRDLRLRPYSTPEDILRVVPGLVIAQHQGGGKADQLFLRGFDADHGTDVALSIDGIPINLPSHAHGQGYADLHFLIPEIIDRVDVLKGPYFVEVGDFATAGAVNLRTRHSFAESSVQATYGSFQTWRVLGVGSTGSTPSPTWMAAEAYGTQGPFEAGQDLKRYNLFLKSTLQISASTRLGILAGAYGSQWRSSGQIPLRFTELPESDPAHLDRFGAIDPTEGGQTQRQMLALTVESRPSDSDDLSFTAYLVRYRLTLFNDFTFQLRDEANFDEIEQTDSRVYTGLNATYRHRLDLGTIRTVTTLGAQARLDSTTVGMWHVKQRARLTTCAPVGTPELNPCTLDDVVQSDLGAFLQEDVRFTPWLRVLLGVRGDLIEWNVTNTSPNPSTLPNQGTGVVQRGIVNPKLQAVITPGSGWDLYLDAGGGFHSNDARAAVAQNGVGALPRAWGAEVGTRLSLLDGRLDLAAAFWFLHLQSETVFVADQGTTEPSDPTDRYGLDLEVRFRILPWMWADADLTLAHAAYSRDQGNGSAVPLAPTLTGQAGLSVLRPAGWRGRLGGHWVGGRPATTDPNDSRLQAQGYFLVDLTVAYRWRFLEAGLVVENVLDTSWREAQFADASYVAGRDAPSQAGTGVTDIHFTPGNPINVRGTLALYF